MTWIKNAMGPAFVQAFSTTTPEGKPTVQLSVGPSMAFLTPEDAASLGGYLLGSAPDSPKEDKE